MPHLRQVSEFLWRILFKRNDGVRWISRPAKTVVGDYYGFLDVGEGEVALVIVNAAGKGVAAGRLMPSAEVALRLNVLRFREIIYLLRAFNKAVHQIMHGQRFISTFYARLCIQTQSP